MLSVTPTKFPPPKGLSQLKKLYGDFEYKELSKGGIDINDTWEKDNLIVLRNVCKTGLNIQLHHLVAPLFAYCLADAILRCPKYKIRMLGGFCARHMMNDSTKPLSTHAWGCAFDINWDKNPVSKKLISDIPEDWIAAFTDHGWEWGGNWKGLKDSMHFQFATGV